MNRSRKGTSALSAYFVPLILVLFGLTTGFAQEQQKEQQKPPQPQQQQQDNTGTNPINFTYDDALASTDGGLHQPSTSDSGLGGTIAEDLLFSGTLGCASCHDVHNADGNFAMLRVDNADSAFCLTCHDK